MSQVIVSSTSRLFPDQSPSTRTVSLSISDSSLGSSGPEAAALWAFDGQGDLALTLTPAYLCMSLIKTLNTYPHWAGQLRYTKYIAGGSHTSRSRRLEVAYGTSTDPGVEFAAASCDTDVSAVFPSSEQRSSGLGAFDASSLGVDKFLPNTPALASHSGGDFAGLPSLIVQVTTFKCGGVVIALKSSHPLADAQALTTFVNDWTVVHRALAQNLPPPNLEPIFSPAALDEAASGDIDAPSPDPEIQKIAHELPIHRYDWWASGDGSPAPESSKIPPHLASIADTLEFGQPLPWKEWDFQAPVSNYLVHFSAEELTRIWTAASVPGETISHLDALQAHVWSLLIRARVPETPEEEFYLNMIIGLRSRVDPPLSARALGSPVLAARAGGTSTMSLAHLARQIRAAVAAFTPPRIGAALHQTAFDLDARRMLPVFYGRRTTIFTSWSRIGMYEVDFGGGRPYYAQGVMPMLDGLVQIMEAMPPSSTGGNWYEAGATVSLTLATEVIQRMLKDPLLRKYREL
ncbi:transferase family-domain-containing protein [Mycena alexandri]|uniref:Transferase family-domain-containing protein n=1 Tax=Mycena alexandri TaxID=1745969 RepID=A0AAD6SUP5_9AGAR|nr:transferase family-domain-containing protein [Mycena alexandri]